MFKQFLHAHAIRNVSLLATDSPLHQRIMSYLSRNHIPFSIITQNDPLPDTHSLLILPLSMHTITPVTDILQQMLQSSYTPLLLFATDFPITTRFKKRFSIAGIIGILELTERPHFIKLESQTLQSNPTASLNALMYTTENLISRNIYKLLSQNILYNAIVKLHPSVVCITTLQGTIIYFRAHRQFFTRNNNIKKLLYGKKIQQFTLHPEKIEHLFSLIDRNIEQRESEITFRINNNDTTLLVTGEKITLYSNVEVYLLIGINITTQRKAEDLLISSELRYRTLVENLPDGLSLSKGEVLLYANPQFFKLFDFPPDTLISEINLKSLIHPDDWVTFYKLLYKPIENAETINVKAITITNKPLTFELRIVSFVSDSSLYHQIYWHDITQTRQLWDKLLQSERLSAIGELASGITHEFNNILTSIQGYVQYTLENPDDIEANKKAFKVIEKMTEQGHAILKNLSMLTRKDITNKERHTITDLVNDILRIQEKILIKDNITLIRKFIKHPVCLVDAGLIQQVILNLLLNSVHAIRPKGYGTITITVDECNGNAIISIHDTGIGIDPKIQDEIFNPFFTTKTGAHNIVGTGMGLSISKNIIEQHNGKIYFQSIPDKETTFTIELPLYKTAYLPKEVDSSSYTADISSLSILIVDDDDAIRDLFKTLLQSLGIRSITFATNGFEGYSLCKDNYYDIVFMDVSMPVLSGIDAYKMIKEENPKQRVIFITGIFYEDQIKEIVDKEHAFGYIKKPFDIKEIKSLLYSIASRR
ncbi:MAG: ATP-binding protein [Spirochaetes bacterium]|nr:ATP-binding protein [Spirochaetota bacterium]